MHWSQGRMEQENEILLKIGIKIDLLGNSQIEHQSEE